MNTMGAHFLDRLPINRGPRYYQLPPIQHPPARWHFRPPAYMAPLAAAFGAVLSFALFAFVLYVLMLLASDQYYAGREDCETEFYASQFACETTNPTE